MWSESGRARADELCAAGESQSVKGFECVQSATSYWQNNTCDWLNRAKELMQAAIKRRKGAAG